MESTDPVVKAVEEVFRKRRSVRAFLPDKRVSEAELRAVLELAQTTPSNCNVQPWRAWVVRGKAFESMRQKLLSAFDSGDLGKAEDPLDTFPGEYRKLQVACAVELYGAMGISRDDQAGRIRAARRNFEFFDAPHAVIVGIDKHFGLGVALDVGMYVQTLLLAFQARGIATCPQASLRHYPHILRAEIGIPEEIRIMCAVSFGYEDPSAEANRATMSREPLNRNVVFVGE